MNWNKAINILNLENIPYNELNIKLIKQKYHKLSLLHHPDKNNHSEQSKVIFQDINEAYSFINEKIINEQNCCNLDNTFEYFKETQNDDISLNSFSFFLKIFIQSIFEKEYVEPIFKIVDNILKNYKSFSFHTFDGLDKEYCLMIYLFILKYKNVLHLDQNVIEKIRDIILKKYDNVFCYTLNPTLNDLFENNVFKLVINEKVFIVPLWHNELHFSGINNEEYIVLCNPSLSDSIMIDENNNIIIDYTISLEEFITLWKKNSNIEILLDVNRNIIIPLDKLLVKNKQRFTLDKQGISIIKDDIYDIDEKSDIIVNINILFE